MVGIDFEELGKKLVEYSSVNSIYGEVFVKEKTAKYGEEEFNRIKRLARFNGLTFVQGEMVFHPESFTQEELIQAAPEIKKIIEQANKEFESYEKFNRKET